MKNYNIDYPGWELKYFDKANNFRNYQFLLIKNKIKGNVAEVGPGNGINYESYCHLSNKNGLHHGINNELSTLLKYDIHL